MNRKSLRLGLIGKDVSQSTSDKIHQFILEKLGVALEYEKFSVGTDDFDTAMRRLLGDFDGFNVTIPYKRDVFEYLDEIVGDAFAFSSVNTVVSITRTGYNTDGVGFMLMLNRAGLEVTGKKVLVLGAGGAGRSTAAALKQAGACVYLYQRNQEKLREACLELGVQAALDVEQGGYDVLINCTGVGMHDSEGRSPVTANAFHGGTWAVDLIYRPKESEFLRLARTQGLKTCNGEAMLFYQAYYADCLFLNRTPCESEAENFYKEYLVKNG